MDDPLYSESYYQHMQDFLDTVWLEAPLKERLQAEHDLIEPYVVGEGGEVAGYTTLTNIESFESELTALEEHVAARRLAAMEAIAAAE